MPTFYVTTRKAVLDPCELRKLGYLTTLGRTVATAALKLRELVIIPLLNQPVPA